MNFELITASLKNNLDFTTSDIHSGLSLLDVARDALRMFFSRLISHSLSKASKMVFPRAVCLGSSLVEGILVNFRRGGVFGG